MASPSRGRRKTKLTPFTVDELLDNPAMSGFVSFLDVHPEHRASPPPDAAPEPPNSSLPESNLQPGSNILPDSPLPPGSNLLPERTLPPAGNLLIESNLPPGSTLPAGGNLLSGSDLRTENGRTVRIRPANTVQDAHTPAENALFEILWGKGTAEGPDTRLVQAGLADISRWTGAHKTSCRAYLRALIAKLAIDEAETFNASAGKDGARVYRIYSSAAVLERRRRAGFTHVIRTGAINFVDPSTGSKLLPDR